MPNYQLSTINEKDLKGISLEGIQQDIENRTGQPLVLSYAYNLLRNESNQWETETPKLLKADELFARLLELHGQIKAKKAAIKEAEANKNRPPKEEVQPDVSESQPGRLRLVEAKAKAEAEAAEAELALIEIELSLPKAA